MSTERTSFQNLTATLIFAAMVAVLMLCPSARAYGADENSILARWHSQIGFRRKNGRGNGFG